MIETYKQNDQQLYYKSDFMQSSSGKMVQTSLYSCCYASNCNNLPLQQHSHEGLLLYLLFLLEIPSLILLGTPEPVAPTKQAKIKISNLLSFPIFLSKVKGVFLLTSDNCYHKFYTVLGLNTFYCSEHEYEEGILF